ncbi:MAG: hypothetical protein NT084_14940 [Bacteroidetes bacterium]|nr:hypothetical protein [Bacteroidota bacterium]
MKKLFIFCSLALVFTTCSTKLDILDNWKETSVVYCLLDQSQAKQYVRIEKAFLGPDNALTMAQNYDSINYTNSMDVWLQELGSNGVPINIYHLSPDTITNKDLGDFYAPEYVIYSLSTPLDIHHHNTVLVNTSHKYHLVINNSLSGNSASATTSMIDSFNITRPTGNQIDIRKIMSNSMVDVQWTGTLKARVYQVAARFHYKERDLSNNITLKVTPDWMLSSLSVDSNLATEPQGIRFDPNSFYRYLSSIITADPNVSARESDYMEFVIFAGGEELQTYMTVNGPSTSLVQEKPLYTNINNGLGLFSSRYQKFSNEMALTLPTKDTLAMGQYSCHLKFLDRNEHITNNLDLPPGCQ